MRAVLRLHGGLGAPEPGDGLSAPVPGDDSLNRRAITVGERLERPRNHGPARLRGLLMAVAMETGILGALTLVRTAAPPRPSAETAVTLVTVAAPAPATPKPASLAPLSPLAVPPAAAAPITPLPDLSPPDLPSDLPLAAAAEIPLPRHLPIHAHARVPRPMPAVPADAPTLAAAPPGPTVAAAQSRPGRAAPAALSGGAAMDSFEGRLRAAVQAALRYPAAARMMGATGHARVGFHWRDGATSELQLVSSAGMAALDQAALEAVQRAAYPQAPQNLAHQTLDLIVHVDFNPPEDN